MKKENICRRIEDKLLSLPERELTHLRQEEIIRHVKGCTSCRSFYESLITAFSGSKDEAAAFPRASPDIKQRVMQNLAPRLQSISVKPVWWESLLRLLQIPIPVYQAALVGLVVAFLVIIPWGDFLKHPTTVADTGQYVPVIDNFEKPLKRQVGISAKEDTSFSRYFYRM